MINFYFQANLVDFLITFFASLLTSYLVFYYLIEKFVYSKIKLIYKLIHNLKLGKDLKDALGIRQALSDSKKDQDYFMCVLQLSGALKAAGYRCVPLALFCALYD
jgi:hypothetical protein